MQGRKAEEGILRFPWQQLILQGSYVNVVRTNLHRVSGLSALGGVLPRAEQRRRADNFVRGSSGGCAWTCRLQAVTQKQYARLAHIWQRRDCSASFIRQVSRTSRNLVPRSGKPANTPRHAQWSSGLRTFCSRMFVEACRQRRQRVQVIKACPVSGLTSQTYQAD